ncbi:MAG: hypothetical protein GX042_09575 [Bacteroidales bacterium]|jgi:C-terminal processing protease CtpA/Prc|nr:hypothetical protein [Bacteroidales bacterium]
MKHTSYILLATLLFLFQSCIDNGPGGFNEKIISASFNPIEKVFLVTYENGETEILDALFNSTVSPTTAEVTLKNGTHIHVKDASEAGEILFNEKGNYSSSSYEQSSSTFKLFFDSGFSESLKAVIITDLNGTTAIRRLSDESILLYELLNPSDDVIRITNKGNIRTASYNINGENNFFTLRYSSGYKESVLANIDHSTDPPTADATLRNGLQLFVENATVSGEAIVHNSQSLNPVNNWIFENLYTYYLWNHKLAENPNYSLSPEGFFYSILNTYNAASNPEGDRFSWIQDNYLELQESLSGVVSDEIGFEYIFVRTDESGAQYYALVLYPRPGTDAEAKGLKRGRWVTKIDGQNITPNNYRELFGGSGSKTLSLADWTLNSSTGDYYLKGSGDVNLQMHAKYAENPVYYDKVITKGNKKIGYLVYHFFARDKGDDSNSYDKLLMQKLSTMKSQGINEMVLDLRYNGGGAVSSAIALASALVKDRSTKKTLVTSQYNSIVHSELKREYGSDYNKDFFIDRVQGTTISIPALNLPRLYVLTSNWTASASEFVINGLKPYMDVTIIGETTYGKNVGSITLYEEDEPNNKWGLQPIVVKYFNNIGESDFTAGFTPDYEVDEFEDLYLYPYGDSNDPMLAKALSLITGTTSTTRSARVSTPFRSSQVDRNMTERMLTPHRFDMQDDVRGDAIKKLMKK